MDNANNDDQVVSIHEPLSTRQTEKQTNKISSAEKLKRESTEVPA